MKCWHFIIISHLQDILSPHSKPVTECGCRLCFAHASAHSYFFTDGAPANSSPSCKFRLFQKRKGVGKLVLE